MFNPISIDEFVKISIESNPNTNKKDFKEALIEGVRLKKKGTKCDVCGNTIWAIGTSIVGWNGCFSCITGEADNSEDYEIDTVCFD